MPAIDLAGIEMLREWHEDLAQRGIELRVAEAHGRLRDTLRSAGLDQQFGPMSAYTAVAATIRHWEASNSSPPPADG